MEKAKTVEEYIAKQPKENQKLLRDIRKIIKASIPKETVEKISWGMPMYYYKGMFLAIGGFKDHCSLFVMGTALKEKFAKELKPYKMSKGTIQFTKEKPLSATLVKKIIKERVKENDARKK